MADIHDAIRAALQAFMAREGIQPTPWERAAKMGDGTLTKFLSGSSKSTTLKTIGRLAVAAQAITGRHYSTLEILQMTPSNDRDPAGEISSAIMQDDPSMPPLVLWRSSPGTQGNAWGGWMLSKGDAGTAPRPESLRYTTLANGFKVLDHNNKPVYCFRDTVLVDRETPAETGEDCAFSSEPIDGRMTRVVVGKLVRETDSLWIISQYADPKEMKLPKAEFPSAWPIVGRYHRR